MHGLGVAMKGSTPVVTEIADEITDTNNEEGVAKILKKYCLQIRKVHWLQYITNILQTHEVLMTHMDFY